MLNCHESDLTLTGFTVYMRHMLHYLTVSLFFLPKGLRRLVFFFLFFSFFKVYKGVTASARQRYSSATDRCGCNNSTCSGIVRQKVVAGSHEIQVVLQQFGHHEYLFSPCICIPIVSIQPSLPDLPHIYYIAALTQILFQKRWHQSVPVFWTGMDRL